LHRLHAQPRAPGLPRAHRPRPGCGHQARAPRAPAHLRGRRRVSARPRPAPADGTEVDLEALATEICARYRAEYPDEDERYGAAGEQWCRHDNQYLVSWAVLDTREYVSI